MRAHCARAPHIAGLRLRRAPCVVLDAQVDESDSGGSQAAGGDTSEAGSIPASGGKPDSDTDVDEMAVPLLAPAPAAVHLPARLLHQLRLQPRLGLLPPAAPQAAAPPPAEKLWENT